ncbi:tetratricopeptide repeat protein [Neptunomonas phycophila]|uniref:Tetratricopeptide repeat protein n=1 Tax=Neptunomonas phycophila TaxID=1572645 RepID=A0AAW7XM70_9GAMM|nr:tetratricopeptide repeat protein [Neptunomonas phycophila]MDO6455346.1 tetratricopeptide repeat protein [Neptunomonas phycophila]
MSAVNRKSVEFLLLEAKEFEESSDFEGAVAIYKEIIDSNKGRLVSAFFRLALVLEKLNKHTEAKYYYHKLINEFDPRPVWFFRLAYCYELEGCFSDSLDCLNKAYELEPKSYNYLFKIIKLLVKIKDYDRAKDKVLLLLKENKNSENLLLAGDLFSQLGETDKAVCFYEDSFFINSDKISEKSLKRMSSYFFGKGDYDKSIFYLLKLTKLYPNPVNYALLANSYKKDSQYLNAISCYKKSVSLDESKHEWFTELGHLLADIDKESAIKYYNSAIKLGRKALSYEVAVLSAQPEDFKYFSPHRLVTPNRLDLCVKYLFAQELLNNISANSTVSFKELYSRHIYLRTKGKEPDNSNKNTVDDYLVCFEQTLISIKNNGFSINHAIPIDKEFCLLNGAHRTASALALNLDEIPVYPVNKLSKCTWNFEWFMNRGFDLSELNEIILCFLLHNNSKSHVFILWPPVMDYWDEIEATISDSVEIITKRDLKFSDLGFSELIKDIYSMDSVAEFMPNIMLKSERLAAFAPKIRLLVVYGDTEKVSSLKSSVRKAYNSIIPEKLFCTLHASSDHQETMHLARIFFHQPTLELLQNRSHSMSKHLAAWVKEAKDELIKRNVEVTEGCAVGGAVLDAFGIRNADDLDITVSNSVRASEFTKKAMPLSINVDLVNENYARSASGIISDEVLINDRAHHVYIRGFKFANLDIVRNRKAYSQRDKDMMDLKNITKFYWR